MLVILAVALFLFSLLLPLIYDVKLRDRVLQVVVFGFIPIAGFSLDTFEEVYVEEGWRFTNPFRSLALGNRPRSRYVIVERRGLIRYIAFTPGDPDAFVEAVKHAR
jgi:hypothetical protein